MTGRGGRGKGDDVGEEGRRGGRGMTWGKRKRDDVGAKTWEGKRVYNVYTGSR
jgi:hypothetical protein